MDYIALGLALLALALAVVAWGRMGVQASRIEDVGRDLRRRIENLSEDSEGGGGADLRQLVAALAEGASLTAEMVMEGRLWNEVPAAEGIEMITTGGARVIDVRNPSETASGVLPEAILIPLDQLEARVSEIPRDGKTTLVYCAMGVRSASACEFLSSQGITGLNNLAGGIGAWTGPTVQP